jgi:prolyl oligopeptidase
MRRFLAVALVGFAGCVPAAPPTRVEAPKRVEPSEPAGAPVPPAKPVDDAPPVARRVDTIEHPFNVEVADPYRWMEGTDNPEFKAWLTAQGEYATKLLGKLPGRDTLRARVRELGLGVTAVFNVQIQGGRAIYSVLPAGAQLAKLATRDGATQRILIDPEKLGAADKHASLSAYSLSPNGKLVSYVIATGGGEKGELHVMDVATGKELTDATPRIWGEFPGSWLPDSSGYFYTQLAVPGAGADPMLNMICRLHKLGDADDRDLVVLGRSADTSLKLAPEEFPGVWVPPGTSWMLAFIGGAHSEQRVAIAKLAELDRKGTGKTPWKLVGGYDDAIEDAFPHGDRLFIRTYKGAPNRRLISVPLAAPDLAKARVDIAEDPEATMAYVSIARDALYVVHDVAGLARLSRWKWSGKPAVIALPEPGWIPDFATDMQADGATFQIESWLRPGRYVAYDMKKKTVAPIGLESSAREVSDRVVAEEVVAPNPDGTQVPLSILHLKGIALDGSHPTVVGAYAAYGVTQHPDFSATRLAWFERGGVAAICHARGGGEKGRKWQDDGSRDKKMNGIHDLIACAEYLVAHQYTVATRIAIEGGSMGGIIVGRAMTERPDLFGAVHIAVGALNPLRALAAENGANQKTELGDPETEAGFKSILAFDPYQHVKPNAAYPAVIFTIGLNDHRINPWMTGKMAARLQGSTTSRKPVIVRVEADAGHGVGSTRDQAFAERADDWAFMLAAFADPAFMPRAAR